MFILEPVTSRSTVPIADILPNEPLSELLLDSSILDVPIILHTLSDLVLSLDAVGIHLGLRGSVIEEIKVNDNYQVSMCRKSIFSSSTATKEGLITALIKKAKKNHLAMKVHFVPTHI